MASDACGCQWNFTRVSRTVHDDVSTSARPCPRTAAEADSSNCGHNLPKYWHLQLMATPELICKVVAGRAFDFAACTKLPVAGVLRARLSRGPDFPICGQERQPQEICPSYLIECRVEGKRCPCSPANSGSTVQAHWTQSVTQDALQCAFCSMHHRLQLRAPADMGIPGYTGMQRRLCQTSS